MTKRTITIEGVAYPCAPNMGAFLRYEREMGKPVSDGFTTITELVTFLWACVKSACDVEGREFVMTVQEMADRLDPSDVASWQTAAAEVSDAEDKKKV